MAVADVYTWNLLNQWQIEEAESPWHYNQISGSGDYAPLSQQCDQVYINEEIRQIANALVTATETAAGWLHFYPRPTYLTQRLEFGGGFPYPNQLLNLDYGYLVGFGSRATSLVAPAQAIVYSDTNADGIDDTATITVNTTITDPSEIRIFFQVADGADGAADERWEIEPTKVTIANGVATIVARRWWFANPLTVWAVPYDGPNYETKHAGDTQTVTDFVTAVDVYRVYTDTTNALTLNYGPNCPCSTFAYSTYDGDGLIVDSRLSSVRFRGVAASCPGYWPVSVDVNYLAGFPLKNNRMDRELQQMIIRLANCDMPQQLQNFCDRTLDMWQFDTAYVDPRFITSRTVDNPLGMKNAQIDAWKIIRRRALGTGGKVTA